YPDPAHSRTDGRRVSRDGAALQKFEGMAYVFRNVPECNDIETGVVQAGILQRQGDHGAALSHVLFRHERQVRGQFYSHHAAERNSPDAYPTSKRENNGAARSRGDAGPVLMSAILSSRVLGGDRFPKTSL